MPELPEVETISRILREGIPEYPSVLNRTIQKVDILWQRTIAFPDPIEFARRVEGQSIREVGRRGKFLRLGLRDDHLLVHLRMSGDLFTRLDGNEIKPHDRLIFHLSGEVQLVFNDTRKFGRVWLVADPQEVTGRLGFEPLSDAFTPRLLFEGLQRRKRQIKPLLLDQSFIAGLGNIYTDEALHLAKIHPLTLSNQINFSAAVNLWQSIRQALNAAIERNGTSIDWVYRGGDYQRYLKVYGRTGDPCQRCGTLVERIVLGQRATHFCPTCQPMP
jgi:formamidopyrimidine-DNA glycosylase